jgi:hypothetical protein
MKTIYFLRMFCLIIIFNFQCYAQPILSSELINNAKQYDKSVIQYQGEVIGEKMVRGNYSWLNVNDGYMAIGIWTKNDLTQTLQYYGNYTTKGDTIIVTGIFHRACPEHGGDLDIHAQTIKKVTPGNHKTISLNIKRFYLALFLSILLLLGLTFKKIFISH